MTEPIRTDNDEAADELDGIPLLGPSRRQTLAAMGITTRDALRALPEAELAAAIKGLGTINAAKILTFLTENPDVLTPRPPSLEGKGEPEEKVALSETLPSEGRDSREAAGLGSSPPPPPDFDAPPAPDFDAPLASVNQALFDARAQIADDLSGLKSKIPSKSRAKKLDVQIKKLASAVAETAGGTDTLTEKHLLETGKAVSRIQKELEKAKKTGKWSEKKQDDLAETLRARRKGLEKALGE